MAQLTHIVYPDGSTSVSIPFVVGTGTTAGTWLGTLEGLTEYYDGLLFLYKSPVAGASTTTLNLNGLGAKTCYVNNSTKLTTHYTANQPILLTYSASTNSGCFVAIDNYWTDSNTIGEYAGACKAGTNGMARYSLIMQTKQLGNDETWESLVTTSSTATTKAKNTSGFIVGSSVLYQSGDTYAEGGVAGTSDCWSTSYNIDTRYSCNVSSRWSAAGRPFFIKGTINTTDGLFYLADTTWWADAYPTTNDGFYYIYVGQMRDAYRFSLHPTHPIFYYDTGLKVLINGNATNANTVNGHTVNSDVPVSAVFTDEKVTQTATDSTDANYEILFSGTADNTTRTEGVRKASKLLYNSANNALTIGDRVYNSTIGANSISVGTSHTVSSGSSAAFGFDHAVTAGKSFAEGEHQTIGGECGHAENYHNTIGSNGRWSHVEGAYNTVNGECGHAEGIHNTASGSHSHVEGEYNTASGTSSHAEGCGTVANHYAQHVFGRYNIPDPNASESTAYGTYIEIVGNGVSANSLSNARTLDFNGNEVLAGKLTVGADPTANMHVATKQYVDNKYESKSAVSGGTDLSLVTTGEKYIWNNKSDLTLGTTATTALKGDTKYAGSSSAGGTATSAEKLTNTSKIGNTNKPVYFTANGVPAAISYTIDKSVPSDAIFTDANVTQTVTDSTDATYELLFSSSADNTTHTEGTRKTQYLTYKSDKRALTLGTKASNSTIGQYSVSMGAENEVSGDFSHAVGYGLIANHKSQYVFGEYNIADDSTELASNKGNYIEIIGNGVSAERSNARTLDWEGNEWVAGKITALKNIYRKTQSVEVDNTASNHVSADVNYGFFTYDKNDFYTGGCITSGTTTGDISTRIAARNKKSSDGQEVINVFNIGVKKDGSKFYEIGDQAAFRQALGITVTNYDLATDKSLASSTTSTSLHSFSLDPGTYILDITVSFASNSAGRRVIALSSNGTTANQGYQFTTQLAPANGVSTIMHMGGPFVVTGSSASTYYVIGHQNSGSTLTTAVRVRALKLI